MNYNKINNKIKNQIDVEFNNMLCKGTDINYKVWNNAYYHVSSIVDISIWNQVQNQSYNQITDYFNKL